MPEIKTNKSLLTGIVVFVAYNLIYGLREGIDNAAHIGGLVSGLALGYLYYAGRHTDLHRYYATSCLTIAALAAFIFLAGKKDDSIAFSKLLDQFVVIEQEAMQPLINKETLTPEEFIRQSKEISLPQWQKASHLLQPAFNYRMPEEMHARRALLVEYVKLRSSLTYALIKYENSGAIEDLIDARYLGTRIERIIQELNP